ncbi:MAG: hypothetical protein K2H09_05445 [Treponemataceae bacterium]|nr:hypothetical protein [Treponemataceae bacterium]
MVPSGNAPPFASSVMVMVFAVTSASSSVIVMVIMALFFSADFPSFVFVTTT